MSNNKYLQPCVCYKCDTPVVYNPGTPYEKKEDTFLYCYAYSDEKAQEIADEMNAQHSDRHYYVHHQEAMGD